MAADGRTVIFISHKLNEVKAVADRVTVLRGGRSVATIAPIATPPVARRADGRARDLDRRREPDDGPAEIVLEVDGLCARNDRGSESLAGVTLSVRAGEIVGVAGVAGNGQRELAETVTGMRRPSAGSIRVAGRELRGGDPREAIRAGIAHVPEDRLHTGVASGLSIASNVALKTYRNRAMALGPLLNSRDARLASSADPPVRREVPGCRRRRASSPAAPCRRW